MTVGTGDIEVSDEDILFRRIHPDQVIHDKNTGELRPSSGAFKDHEMSVDIESKLAVYGLDWNFTLRNHPGYSLVRLTAGTARSCGQMVTYLPLSDNPAHGTVTGRKTQGTANILMKASEWVKVLASGSPQSPAV